MTPLTLDLLVIGRGGHPVEPAGECYLRSRQRQSVSPWVGRGRTVKVVPTFNADDEKGVADVLE
jgi:hypothetical protein